MCLGLALSIWVLRGAVAGGRADDLAFPGGVLWQITFETPPAHIPAFDHQSAYVAFRDGSVRALDHATGAARWSAAAPSTVPPASSGRFVAGAEGSEAWALDAVSGARRWRTDLGATSVATPLATPAGVVHLTGAGELVMLGWEDGRVAWRTGLPCHVSAPPAAGADSIWTGCDDGRVLAVRIADGQLGWTRRLAGRVLAISPAADRLVVGSSDNFLYALKASDGGVSWRWRTGGDVAGQAVADGRRVYFVSLDSMLRANDVRHGDLRWQRPLTTRAVGGPVLAGAVLIVAGVSPELRAFRTSDGGVVDSAPLPGRALHTPVLEPARGSVPVRLVLLTAGGHLLAIGQTVEPRLVPFDVIPGRLLKPEVLPIIR